MSTPSFDEQFYEGYQEPKEDQLVLGLDLGVTSIGWALVRHRMGDALDGSKDEGEIIAAGSRIFQAVHEDEKGKIGPPKSATRRTARGARRRGQRTKMRLAHLTEVLQEHQMLPEAGAEWEELFSDFDRHPLKLRALGLSEALTLQEFGRCLYHIGKRRGFKSNKGTKLQSLFVRRRPGRRPEVIQPDPEIQAALDQLNKKDHLQLEDPNHDGDGQTDDSTKAKKGKSKEERADKESEGVVLKAISELRQHIQAADARTLGEYLYQKVSETDDAGHSLGTRVRGTRTARDLYETEFDLLFEAQRPHWPRVLTDGLKVELHNILFFQRPLKVQRFLIENCPFETGRKRARAGYPAAQEFRIWQDLNNLRILGRRMEPKVRKNSTKQSRQGQLDIGGQPEPDVPAERPLTQQEKEKLAAELLKARTLSWVAIKKLLDLGRASFNLEKSKTKGLSGCETWVKIESAAPGLLARLDAGEVLHPSKGTTLSRDNLIEDLFSIADGGTLLTHLRRFYGLSPEETVHLATTEFPGGTMSLSLKAIRSLLGPMKRGLGYHEACQVCGYERRDQKTIEGQPQISFENFQADCAKVKSPLVRKCLSQTRHLVNEVVRQWQMPDVIRIEMARDLKLTQKQKDEITKANREQEKIGSEAAAKHRELGLGEASKEDILRYKLWKEAGEVCFYTGRTISLAQVWSPETEVDHIIPWAISLDDSFANKTLCFADANRDKGRRTPWQKWGQDAVKFQEMVDRLETAKAMAPSKRRRFRFTDEDLLKFEAAAGRLLTETQFLARCAKDMLLGLGCRVEPSKGKITARLRQAWGLNTVLQEPDEDGVVADEKNRDNHLHHAIDAIVIALTSVSMVHRMSWLAARQDQQPYPGQRLECPRAWPSLREDVRKCLFGDPARGITPVLVSHEPSRGIKGAISEETVYGAAVKEGRLVYRASLANLTDNAVERIRDPYLRKLIAAALKEAGGKAQVAFPDGLFRIAKPNGKVIVVKSIRLFKRGNELPQPQPVNAPIHGFLPRRNRDGEVIGWLPTGANHHLAVYQDERGRRSAECISVAEALRRRRCGEPIYQDHPDGRRRVMVLHRNDTVLFETERRGLQYYRVASISTKAGLMLELRLLNDRRSNVSTAKSQGGELLQSPNALQGIDRVVTPRYTGI